MKRWTCTLEVVTPLFLGGADQIHAELRPSALKALMRWWYRAARGVADEGPLFGSTEQASKYRLRLRPKDLRESILFDKANFSRYPGIQYFAFSLDSGSGPDRKQREFIPPGSTFQLELSFLPFISEPEKRGVFASLWFLIWLGGIGSRGRRGFGSVRVKEAEVLPWNETAPSSKSTLQLQFAGSVKDLAGFLQQNISVAKSWVGHPPPGTSLPDFTVLGSLNSRLYVWKAPFGSWEQALDTAGTTIQSYRNRYGKGGGGDYDQVNDFLRDPSSTPTSVDRVAFGLPIQFYFRSVEQDKLAPLIERELARKGVANAAAEAKRIAALRRRNDRVRELKRYGMDDGKINALLNRARREATAVITGEDPKIGGHDRRASPLFVKVLKINDQQYALLFLLIKARILGRILERTGERDERIKIETKGRAPALLTQPSFQVVDDFLKNHVAPHAWEIKL
ncbi:MAG: type III-B CRISPR module RAMP protein Cmr1 [Candidatus Methanomethylicaceae archaeon]